MVGGDGADSRAVPCPEANRGRASKDSGLFKKRVWEEKIAKLKQDIINY